MALISRFFKGSEDSFFLFGPRGTGKSTWLRENCPKAVVVDLLAPDVFRDYSARPERLRDAVAASPNRRHVIVDEVQKVPEILDVVHQMMESDKSLQFILTGSSARKLKRAGTDLLSGRALLKTLHPFMAAELGPAFNLDRALSLGMLPVVLDARRPDQALAAYLSLYLCEEVKMEGLVRNIGAFGRFLEAMSFSHGSVLNVSVVARECQVSRKTTEGFVEILEDLLLGFRVPVFSRRARRHLIQHPKFYYFDSGVFRSIRPQGPLDAPTELAGAGLEGLVAQHLRAWTAYGNEESSLHFWRTKSGQEVDFVIYGPGTFVAIEVKNSASVHRKDLRPLIAFREDYPEAEVCLLYRGNEALKMADVLCLPCESFLRGLDPARPLAEAFHD